MAGKGELLANFIRQNNIRKFLELGVYKGKLIRHIMTSCSDVVDEYWGVDKWEFCEEYLNRRNPVTAEQWEKNKWWSYKVASYWKQQVRLINLKSHDAVGLFDDGYFDFVFVDAEHTYDPMREYISDWLPKVRGGGIFGGHDYDKEGVRKAVGEYFGASVMCMDYDCWYVVK